VGVDSSLDDIVDDADSDNNTSVEEFEQASE
jgi:hypothetical protein